MNNLEHQLIPYNNNSGHDNSADPITKISFEWGESVIVCRDKNSLISPRSLEANDDLCPFCLRKLNHDLASIEVTYVVREGKKTIPSDPGSRQRFSNTSPALWGVLAGVMLLCLVAAGIGIFVTIGGSGGISNPNLIIPLSTLSRTPPVFLMPSITPESTLEVILTLIPQSTKTPQSITLPSASDPEEFTRLYFTSVWKNRDYRALWDNYLTTSFQNHGSPGGFKEYTDWWSSVKQIDIHAINIIENDGHNAWIHIKLTFHLNDGRVLSNREYDYDLIFNSDRNSWMFDYHN